MKRVVQGVEALTTAAAEATEAGHLDVGFVAGNTGTGFAIAIQAFGITGAIQVRLAAAPSGTTRARRAVGAPGTATARGAVFCGIGRAIFGIAECIRGGISGIASIVVARGPGGGAVV